MADAVSPVWHLLSTNATLIAQVPAARITAGVIQQGTTLPAIGVNHISTVREQSVSGPTGICRSRIQVTVHADTYPKQRSILALVRAALPRSRGTVNGVAIDSIVTDTEGPDARNDAAGIYQGSQDFLVVFTE